MERGYEDPPRRLLRFDGKPAIGLGISTVQGGNVVTMGNGVRRKLEELKRNQPIGIEIGEINFQPEAVTTATNAFIFNLVKAVTIVFVVLLFAMGRRAGMIIGVVLFLTIMATFLVMYFEGQPPDGAHFPGRVHHRAVHAHRQRDRRHRGDQGPHRVRRGQDRR